MKYFLLTALLLLPLSVHGLKSSTGRPFRKWSRLENWKVGDISSFISNGQALVEKFFAPQSILADELNKKEKEIPKIDLTIYDADINAAKAVLLNASISKSTESFKVIEGLSSLEKLMRAKNRLDEGITSRETLAYLNGDWRLIFSTGTVNIQKKIGKVNYFPLKAIQSFNTSTVPYKISNGIYIGDFAVLKFFGEFTWAEAARKLEFDFDEIAVLGLRLTLPKGGAAKIGSSTGLGAEKQQLTGKTKRPFFNWISADEQIATARGGGGGLALWRRVPPTDTTQI